MGTLDAVSVPDKHERGAAVAGITALVKVWDGVQRVYGRGDHDHESSVEGASDPDRFQVSVRLTAQIEERASVTSGHDDFGISGCRAGLAGIEGAINQMLGRDPEQHRPPRLAWAGLIEALADVGVVASEQELIDAPLTVQLAPEVKARIAHNSP